MFFVIVAIALPSRSTLVVAGIALPICFAIELSQLYHAPWIDAIRRTLAGALVLGHGFLWSDLACYVAGVMFGASLETLVRWSGGEDGHRMSG